MKINVTQEDIDKANESFDNRYNCGTFLCPVQQALIRLGYTNPQVGYTGIITHLDGEELDFYIPKDLQEQIANWDIQNQFEPGEYEVN